MRVDIKDDDKVEVSETKKKRGRGRPPKKDGPAKRDVRCSLTDYDMAQIEKARNSNEKSIAAFVRNAVRAELSSREQRVKTGKISLKQRELAKRLGGYIYDDRRLRLLEIVLDTAFQDDMFKRLQFETNNAYPAPKLIV